MYANTESRPPIPNSLRSHSLSTATTHSITRSASVSSTVTYGVGSEESDELWRIWSKTESKDQVLRRLGQMLETVDSATAVRLVRLWRHISCTANYLREDREVELFNLVGSPDLAEVRF